MCSGSRMSGMKTYFSPGLLLHGLAMRNEMSVQVLKGVHGGIREVALKMLLDVEDPQSELERFTKARIMAFSLTCPALKTVIYGETAAKSLSAIVQR